MCDIGMSADKASPSSKKTLKSTTFVTILPAQSKKCENIKGYREVRYQKFKESFGEV